MKKTIAQWHEMLDSNQPAQLEEILDNDVTFHSPVVHTPQQGKAITQLYLSAAFAVLVNDKFSYVREVIGERDAILEFTTEIDGITINGVDMIRCNAQGKIIDFKVMVRPLKAINLLHQMMAGELQKNA